MQQSISDTIDMAKSTVGDIAKSTASSARDGAEHAVSSARHTFLDGLHAASSFVQLVRSLQISDALGWVGLARRRSPLETLGLFGAGVMVGAAGAALFTPMTGAELRRALFGGVKKVEKEVEREVGAGLDKAASAAKDLEHKVESAAGKAKDTVEHGIADLSGKAKDAVASAERKIESATADTNGVGNRQPSYARHS